MKEAGTRSDLSGSVWGMIARGELPDNFARLFLGVNWMVLAAMTAGAALLSTPQMATGILIGGVMANLNLRGLDKDCKRAVRWGSMAAYYAGMAVRMGLISLAVTVLFLFLPDLFSPLGLFAGLSVGVINFYILTALMVVNRVRFKEAS